MLLNMKILYLVLNLNKLKKQQKNTHTKKTRDIRVMVQNHEFS